MSPKQIPETISRGYKVNDKRSPSTNSSLFGNLVSKIWNVNDDLNISEDSNEGTDKVADDGIFKRKNEASPENEFQLSSKEKRKQKKSRNKSK